jgi:hypothetical protein
MRVHIIHDDVLNENALCCDRRFGQVYFRVYADTWKCYLGTLIIIINIKDGKT